MDYWDDEKTPLQQAQEDAAARVSHCVVEIADAARLRIGGTDSWSWAKDAEDSLREAIAAVVTVEMMKKFGGAE